MTETEPTLVNPRLAPAISRAERRLAKLEALSDLGMTMATEITQRTVSAPYHPEPRHDSGRSFAAVCRTVRLTIAQETRIDLDIIAMRNGELPRRREPQGRARAAESHEVREGREALDAPERCGESLVDREYDDDRRSGSGRAPLHGRAQEEADFSPSPLDGEGGDEGEPGPRRHSAGASLASTPNLSPPRPGEGVKGVRLEPSG